MSFGPIRAARGYLQLAHLQSVALAQEDRMNADVLTTKVADGIAVITLGSARRIYFDAEMGDALTESLDGFAGDATVRVVVITGGAPGYFNRHFDVGVLIGLAESLRASGREWPENATYNGGFFDKAMALCESMPKPVIAAISGTALAGAFEFALSCDLRIAEDGDYLIGLPEAHLGLLPGAGGLIARLLLGLIFLVFGLNGFFEFSQHGADAYGTRWAVYRGAFSFSLLLGC